MKFSSVANTIVAMKKSASANAFRFGFPQSAFPAALQKMLSHYQENRSEGERFNEFLDRVGSASFEDLLHEFHLAGQFNDEPDSMICSSIGVRTQQYVLDSRRRRMSSLEKHIGISGRYARWTR